MSVSRVLQVVVEPQNRTPLQWLGDDHSAIFTHYGSFVNQSDVEILIKDMVALEAMLNCWVNPLSVGNLLGSEGIDFFRFATIGKHIIQISVFFMRAWVLLVIRTP
jgi:hypothetical protein